MHAHRQLCSKCSALQRHRGAPAAQLCPRDEEGLQAGRGERGPQCHRGQRIKRLGGGGRGGATCSHTTTKQDGTTGRGARANRDEAQPVAGGAPCPPTRDRGPPRRPAAMGSEGNRGTAAPVPSEVGGGRMKGGGRCPPAPFPQFGAAGTAPERGGGGTAPAATTQPPDWSRWVPPRRGGSGGGQRPRPGPARTCLEPRGWGGPARPDPARPPRRRAPRGIRAAPLRAALREGRRAARRTERRRPCTAAPSPAGPSLRPADGAGHGRGRAQRLLTVTEPCLSFPADGAPNPAAPFSPRPFLSHHRSYL